MGTNYYIMNEQLRKSLVNHNEFWKKMLDFTKIDLKNIDIDGKFTKSQRECLHDQCTKCNGTGRDERGRICVHHISCPCPKCTPVYC